VAGDSSPIFTVPKHGANFARSIPRASETEAAETIPPRVAPKEEQLYAVFKEHVQDFDDQKQGYDEDLGGQVDQDTVQEMVKLRDTIEKAFMALKKAFPNAAETYPDIATDKRRVYVGLAQLRKANLFQTKYSTRTKPTS
jgi:hypothetical protein